MVISIRVDSNVAKEDDGTFTSYVNLHYCGELFERRKVTGFKAASEAIRDGERRVDILMENHICRVFQDVRGERVPVDFSHLMTPDEIEMMKGRRDG